MFRFCEVGGAVRDKFLGVESKDVDFAVVPNNPEQFNSLDEAFNEMHNFLENLGFKVFISTPEFVTIRAQVPDGHVLKERTNVADFVLARKDGPSSDGRHPDFVLPGTLFDDLARRDFTVNAIALDNNEIVDPFGGMDDLKYKVLRFVGDPQKRIGEDGLRVLRLFRFMITKGFFVDPDAWDAANTAFAAEMLEKVSIERIREELVKMFASSTVDSMELLMRMDPRVRGAIFRDNLRLLPTLKDL